MKKFTIGLTLLFCFSVNASEGTKIYPSFLLSNGQSPSVRSELKKVTSCEKGYYLTRQRISNSSLAQDFETSFAGATFGAGLVGGLVFGNATGFLIIPPLAIYSASRISSLKSYSKAESVFIASRLCNEFCDYEPLNLLRQKLKKDGLDVSNEEIAKIVNEGAKGLELCTSRVNGNGVRKMKNYRALKKAIFQNLTNINT